jgi:hypothetical protein
VFEAEDFSSPPPPVRGLFHIIFKGVCFESHERMSAVPTPRGMLILDSEDRSGLL